MTLGMFLLALLSALIVDVRWCNNNCFGPSFINSLAKRWTDFMVSALRQSYRCLPSHWNSIPGSSNLWNIQKRARDSSWCSTAAQGFDFCFTWFFNSSPSCGSRQFGFHYSSRKPKQTVWLWGKWVSVTKSRGTSADSWTGRIVSPFPPSPPSTPSYSLVSFPLHHLQGNTFWKHSEKGQ